jgi:hypothetical protein
VSDNWRVFRRFWETDRGLSIFLFLLLALIFVVPASGLTGQLGRTVIDVVFTLLMLTGVAALSRQKTATAVVSGVAVAGIAIRWIGEAVPSPSMELAVALSAVASLATLAYVVLARVFRAGPVNRHRIMGAIAVYLLLGLAWGEAFYALALMEPGSFSLAPSATLNSRDLMYFSFVTLTTVGYGDITAISPVARSLAILEALTGQLYPAILLARLVALEVGANSDR